MSFTHHHTLQGFGSGREMKAF